MLDLPTAWPPRKTTLSLVLPVIVLLIEWFIEFQIIYPLQSKSIDLITSHEARQISAMKAYHSSILKKGEYLLPLRSMPDLLLLR